jgi:hypothetical protein
VTPGCISASINILIIPVEKMAPMVICPSTPIFHNPEVKVINNPDVTKIKGTQVTITSATFEVVPNAPRMMFHKADKGGAPAIRRTREVNRRANTTAKSRKTRVELGFIKS